MKIPLNKIMRYIKVKELNFDDVANLMTGKNTDIFKNKNTIECAILYGVSKDLQIQGLVPINNFLYSLKKIKINVVSEKSLDNLGIGLKIQIIYKLSSRFIGVKTKYVASETWVRFPVIEIYNPEYANKWIPLYPYVVKKYIYTFNNFDELEGYTALDEDCTWTNDTNMLKVFFDDANFFIDAMSIYLNETDFIKIIDYKKIGMITYKSLKKKDIQAVNRMDYVVV